MKPRCFYLFIISAFAVFTLSAPNFALATTTRIVDSSIATCDSSLLTNPCYRIISAALTAAASGDTIEIHPGTYTETNIVNKQLTIIGTETARTILSGGGSGPIITISGLTGITIRNLTFTSATTGILAQSSSSVTITNNVFRVGTSGTGVNIQSSSTAVVNNNTFYQNLNALTFASGTNVTILNNIFSNNAGTAVSTAATASSIHNNCYFGNNPNGQLSTDIPTTDVTTDPSFVINTTLGDFHLQAGSPCINTGATSVGNNSIDSKRADIGAYGGPTSDTIPFPVQNLVSSATATTTVHLTWNANLSYQVTGYAVYYGTVSSSLTTTAVPDPGNVTAYDVTSLATATAPTGTPVLGAGIANQTLLLGWNAGGVSNATGYEVRYDTDSAPTSATCPFVTTPTSSSPTIDVGNVTSDNLSGLTNQICYSVLVIPYAQNIYYFTVRAHYANTAFASANSNVVSQAIGGKAYGTASNVIHDFPEAITAYPDLPKKGCFIATAAYGYYSAPQVMVLREFRDQYLLTNALGRAFVRWYYEYGPIGAEYMNSHPWLKPVVRAALMPAIGGALFMTKTSAMTKTFVIALAMGLLILCVALKMRKGEQP